MAHTNGAQELLQKAWTEGRQGYLSAWSQAKAWALREVWRDAGKSDHGLGAYVAGKVPKEGGGHPGSGAIMKFFARIDADPAWFPGKGEHGGGRPRALGGRQAAAVARSAMALKSGGAEPTYARVLAACPEAALNPETQKPVGKRRIYDVLRERCYDEDPDVPWAHKARYSKTALTDGQVAKRYKFGLAVEQLGRSEDWYFKNVVWTDLCNSILPTTELVASEQALARKGRKGWSSPGSELASYNLRGRREVLKQKSFGTQRVWWAPILTRGKLHVVSFPSSFPGEQPAGAQALVEKLLAAVNVRFPNAATKPSWVFVDRGKGFYNLGNGKITQAYKAALKDCGFRAFWGEDASVQPGHLQELMLHETAVSWLRVRLEQSLPPRPWEETPEAYAARLRQCCADVNAQLNVDGLCRAFPTRIRKLVERKGDRLKE